MYPLQPEFQYEVIYSSSPALGLDESVYFVASGRLYAFSSTGSNKWEYVIDNQSTPNRALSPVIGADGTIYVGSFYTRTLYAINRDGTKKWSLALDGGSGESPSIGANGILYVTGFYLNAISALGSNIWENTIPAEASPVIARDGTIYVENPNDTSLWSIKSNGQTNWSAVPTAVFHPPPPTNPAIDSSGMIY